jgi:hypothetical protein
VHLGQASEALGPRVQEWGTLERDRSCGFFTRWTDGLQSPALQASSGSRNRKREARVSDQLLELADFVLRIPMRGGRDSLNTAVATGVLLFEIAGQQGVRHLYWDSPMSLFRSRGNILPSGRR